MSDRMKPLPYVPEQTIFALAVPGSTHDLGLWNFRSDRHRSRLGEVVIFSWVPGQAEPVANVDNDVREDLDPRVAVDSTFAGRAVLAIPPDVLASMYPDRGALRGADDLAAAACRHQSPWRDALVEIDGRQVAFLRCDWASGSVLISTDPRYRVAITDTVAARSRPVLVPYDVSAETAP